MEKWILLVTLFLSSLSAALAQTEISPYLNGTAAAPAITGTAGTFYWIQAVEACRNLVHDSKTDWYLPAYEEIALFGNSTSTTTPACIGSPCNWITATGNSSGTTKVWTRSVSNDNGSNYTYGNPDIPTRGQYSTSQWWNPNTLMGVRCVR